MSDMHPDPPPPAAAPLAPSICRAGTPSARASIDWEDIRVKAWQISLMIASAYVVAYPEKWGWLAPVLTGSAGMSKSPTAKSTKTATTTAGAIAATVALTLGWRLWLA